MFTSSFLEGRKLLQKLPNANLLKAAGVTDLPRPFVRNLSLPLCVGHRACSSPSLLVTNIFHLCGFF
jgi:hypothetical protein